MSSVGQFAGAVVGGAIGLFFGTPILGAQLGMMVGGYIDPPPGPHSEGPRLSDMTVQTSTYGAGKTRAYGTVAVTGNIFWLEGDKYAEHSHDQQSGGKGGGGGATSTTYTYSATFAVALTEGQEITGIRRLWVGDRLIYDAGSDNVESILASNLSASGAQKWQLYTGADNQSPDPRMQADKGAANVSAYPGRAYIVFYDFDLTEHYGNSLMAAQVKVEIVCVGVPVAEYHAEASTNSTDSNTMATAVVSGSKVDYLLIHFDGFYNVVGASIWEHRLYEYDQKVASIDVVMASGYGFTAPQMATCHQCAPGDIRAYAPQSFYLGGPPRTSLVEISAAGAVSGPQYVDGIWKYGSNYIFASDGGIAYAASHGHTVQIMRFSSCIMVGYSEMSVKASSIGYSTNYVYVIDATLSSTSSCTVHKFDRLLGFVATLTLAVRGAYGLLQVIGDDDFFINASPVVSRYTDGVVKVLNAATPTPHIPEYSWFAFSLADPPYGVVVRGLSTVVAYEVGVCHVNLPSQVAKLRDIVTTECGAAGLASGDLDLASLTNSDVRGYRVTGISSPRAALEPLQAAWPFDVYQKGYKVGFKSRGSASVATIEESDLGAAAGRENASLLPVSREMETQIARTVTVKYLDMDRDYEIGEQTAPERPGVSSVEPRQVDLPLVLTADEAMRAADVLNMKEWTERVRFGPFSLPPTYAALEPADVVTVNHRGRAWQARLTRVEYLPDGRLTCDAVLTASAAYSSSATGSNPLVLGQSLVPLLGSSRVILLDIPVVDSAQNAMGLSAVMYGFTPGWPGGVLVRSDDSGYTWQSIQGFDTKASVFTASGSIGATRTDIVDASSVLVVTPDHDQADIFSVTETQLLAGANLAAYGADGRWEIIGIKTAVAGSGTFTLSNFMRGRYGTEAAMSQHAAGDKVVLLSTTNARFVGLPSAAYATPRLWRAVTQQEQVSTASDISHTYAGGNLRPLPPVYVCGVKSASNDWTITWIRRTRVGGEWVDIVDASLGEASEAYEVDIFSDATYTTVKRTLTGLSSASATYSSANQTADFGAAQSTIYVKVYQISASVGRGFPATQALVASVATLAPPEFGVPTSDPYWSSVVLAMHCNGTHGSTTFTDAKGKTVTRSGDTVISTTQAKFGGASAYFDGNGDWLSVPSSTDFNISGINFTLEFFAYISVSGKALVSRRSSGANGWVLNTNGVRAVMNGSWSDSQMGWTEPSLNAWHHYAWVGSGTTLYVFVDGVLVATKTGVTSIADQADALRFGSANNSGETPFSGFIDEVRFTKSAKWTANFTPPLYQYADA